MLKIARRRRLRKVEVNHDERAPHEEDADRKKDWLLTDDGGHYQRECRGQGQQSENSEEITWQLGVFSWVTRGNTATRVQIRSWIRASLETSGLPRQFRD